MEHPCVLPKTPTVQATILLSALSLFPRSLASQEPDLSRTPVLVSDNTSGRSIDSATSIAPIIGDRLRQELQRRESLIKGKLEIVGGQRKLYLGRYPVPFHIEDLAITGGPDALEKFIAAKPKTPGGAKWLVRWESKPDIESLELWRVQGEIRHPKQKDGDAPSPESLFIIEHCPVGRLLSMVESDSEKEAMDVIRYMMRAHEIAPTERLARVFHQKVLLETAWDRSTQGWKKSSLLMRESVLDAAKIEKLNFASMGENCPFLWLGRKQEGFFGEGTKKEPREDPFTKLHGEIVSEHSCLAKSTLTDELFESGGKGGKDTRVGIAADTAQLFTRLSPGAPGTEVRALTNSRIASVESLGQYVRSLADGFNDLTAQDFLSFAQSRASTGATPGESAWWRSTAETFKSEYEALRASRRGAGSSGSLQSQPSWEVVYPWADFSITVPLVETVVGMVEHNLRRKS